MLPSAVRMNMALRWCSHVPCTTSTASQPSTAHLRLSPVFGETSCRGASAVVWCRWHTNCLNVEGRFFLFATRSARAHMSHVPGPNHCGVLFMAVYASMGRCFPHCVQARLYTLRSGPCGAPFFVLLLQQEFFLHINSCQMVILHMDASHAQVRKSQHPIDHKSAHYR